jgi:heme exporter protein B
VCAKDLRAEARTRYALGSVALFSVTTLVMISAALSTAAIRGDTKAAMIWVVLLFAAMSGLARSFVREEEMGTANGLRFGPPATAVYAGKLLFNVALVLAVEVVSVPLFLLLMPVTIANTALFVEVLIVGAIAVATAATFIAALIAQTAQGRSALFTVVAFPVLLPLQLLCVQATIGAFGGLPSQVERAVADLWIIGGYAVTMTVASLLLFEYVWHE